LGDENPTAHPEEVDSNVADPSEDSEGGVGPELTVVPEVEADTSAEPVIEVLVEPEPEIIDPLAELKEQLAAAQARLRKVSKGYRDLQEEMSSFRQRVENQARYKAERQSFEVVSGFFDPVMNLRRCIDSSADDPAGLLNGLQMTQKQFMDVLEKLGLQEVPGVGAEFDPNIHEALAVTPVTDSAMDGKVLMVHANGYSVNGKVLQAAQVVIGKHQEAADEAVS
jgi:molecular chaperone GrpE